MKICRVFMKPSAERWADFQIPDGATAQTLWPQIVSEGVVSNPAVVIPREQIHHMLVLEIEAQQANFTVPPSGKPN